jgi:hypothetical protein
MSSINYKILLIICLIFFSVLLQACNNTKENTPYSMESQLLLDWYVRNYPIENSNTDIGCSADIRQPYVLTYGVEYKGNIKQGSLCYFYITQGMGTTYSYKLLSDFGDTDIAVGYENSYGGDGKSGLRNCIEDRWEKCSINSGVALDKISLAGTAGQYRFVGVYGYFCPGAKCNFSLTIQ